MGIWIFSDCYTQYKAHIASSLGLSSMLPYYPFFFPFPSMVGAGLCNLQRVLYRGQGVAAQSPGAQAEIVPQKKYLWCFVHIARGWEGVYSLPSIRIVQIAVPMHCPHSTSWYRRCWDHGLPSFLILSNPFQAICLSRDKVVSNSCVQGLLLCLAFEQARQDQEMSGPKILCTHARTNHNSALNGVALVPSL